MNDNRCSLQCLTKYITMDNFHEEVCLLAYLSEQDDIDVINDYRSPLEPGVLMCNPIYELNILL